MSTPPPSLNDPARLPLPNSPLRSSLSLLFAQGPEWQEADYAALSIRVDGSKSPLCLVELTALASHLPALSALEKASPKQKVAWTKWLEKAGGATAAPQADSAWQELAVQSQPVQAVKPPPNYSASLVQAKAVAGKAGQPGSHAYHILQITNSCQRLAGRQLLKVRMREDQGGALMVHLYLGAQPAVAEQKAGAEVPPPPTPDPAVVLPLQQGQGGQQGQQQQGQQQQLLQQVQQQRPQQGLAHVKEEQARQEPGDGLVDSILELARQASPHGVSRQSCQWQAVAWVLLQAWPHLEIKNEEPESGGS